MTELTEMMGAEGVSRGLVALLRQRVPRHLARIRKERGLSPEDLPDVDPAHIYTTPQPFAGLSTYPCLMLAVEATDGRATNRTESPSGSWDELVMHYRVQVLAYTLGRSYGLTELAVQRYVLAARAAVISGRAFGDPDAGQWGEVSLERLQEGYAPPDPIPDGTGYLGGGYVQFHVQAHERLWTDDAWEGQPTVEDTRVDTRVDVSPGLLIHPAMDGEPGL